MSTQQLALTPEDGRRPRRMGLILALAGAVLAGSAVTIAVGNAGAGSSSSPADTVAVADTVAADAVADTGLDTTTTDASSTSAPTTVVATSTPPVPTMADLYPPALPPNSAAPPPMFGVLWVDAPSVFVCSEAPGMEPQTQLTLSWATTGAASVIVSIDSPDGTWMDGLPADGSTVVPAPCGGDTNTYYVTAVAPNGLTDIEAVTTEGR